MENTSVLEVSPDLEQWTSKVQIVDKSHVRESRDGTVKFLNLILQDQQENQVQGIIYGNDILYYQDKFKLFHTYMISDARVKAPSYAYGRQVSMFNWVFDRSTIVEPIEADSEESPLPPPTKLTLTPFNEIRGQPREAEFDVLAVVVNCTPPKFVGNQGRKCQEFIIIDALQLPMLFTLWEEFADVEGKQMTSLLHEYPVILARRIGMSFFGGTSLGTKFGSTIQIRPPYLRAHELIVWAEDNKQMLLDYTSNSDAAGTMVVVPFHEETVAIDKIAAQTTGQAFYVEGEMSIPDDLQHFYVMTCSDCKQQMRSLRKRSFHCTHCNRCTTLVPRCKVELKLTDGSGSASASAVGEIGESLLSMTTEHIYEESCAKRQLSSMKSVQKGFKNKTFRVQVKKAFTRSIDAAAPKVSLLSYVVKEAFTMPLQAATSTVSALGDGGKRKSSSVIDEVRQPSSEKGLLAKVPSGAGLKIK